MNRDFFYFRKIRNSAERSSKVLPNYFKSAIDNLLKDIFGEIGGLTTVDVLKFDEKKVRGILRCPELFYRKLRAALALGTHFQGILCRFIVHGASPCLLSLVETAVEF